jgi:hypothetical protein
MPTLLATHSGAFAVAVVDLKHVVVHALYSSGPVNRACCFFVSLLCHRTNVEGSCAVQRFMLQSTEPVLLIVILC